MSTLIVVDNNALADGVARNQVRAHVVDSTGNSVADMAVTFTANRGAQLSKVKVLTDNNGDAVNTLTNSLAGVTVVTAKLGTAGTPLTVDTVFTAGPLATLTLVTTVDNALRITVLPIRYGRHLKILPGTQSLGKWSPLRQVMGRRLRPPMVG